MLKLFNAILKFPFFQQFIVKIKKNSFVAILTKNLLSFLNDIRHQL